MHRPGPRLLLAAMLLSCSREPSTSSPPCCSLAAHSAPAEATHAGEAGLLQWTPEMHAAARSLVDQDFPNGRAAIEMIMKGSHRSPGAADRDRYRHPAETLSFFGFAPTMTVLDIGPGAGDVVRDPGVLGVVLGYYTELVAPALAKHGLYLATNREPSLSAPAPQAHHWSEYEGGRFDKLLRATPDVYGKVQVVRVDYAAPKLKLDNATVDLVLLMREVHMMQNWGTLDTWLREIHRVLKPNGVLGVEEHRASPNADAEASVKTGYLPQAWVGMGHRQDPGRHQHPGFALDGTSEVNANAKDTKDYPNGVWSLPPSFQVGPDYSPASAPDPKYATIGESDRMTLKFVRIERGAAR